MPKNFSLGIYGVQYADRFSTCHCLVTFAGDNRKVPAALPTFIIHSIQLNTFAAFESGTMDTSFESALVKFGASLTESQRRDFAPCTLNDIHTTIEEIQLWLGSQKRLRNMKRIAKFIEAMNQLGQVVEVFLNVENTVAFIWVSTKLLC